MPDKSSNHHSPSHSSDSLLTQSRIGHATDTQRCRTAVNDPTKKQPTTLESAVSSAPCPFCGNQIATKANEICLECPHCQKKLGIASSASLYEHFLFTLPRLYQTQGRASFKEAWSLYLFASLAGQLIIAVTFLSTRHNFMVLLDPWWIIPVVFFFCFILSFFLMVLLGPLLFWGLFVRRAHDKNKSGDTQYAYHILTFIGVLLLPPLLAICGSLVLGHTPAESKKHNIYGPKTQI